MRSVVLTRVADRIHAGVLALLILAPLHHVSAQGDAEVLSNATVVQMVAGKLPRDLIMNKINASRPGFDLSSDGIIGLWSNRVDQNVIKLMLAVAESAHVHGNAPSSLGGLDEVMKNDAVVKMVTGRVPKQLILAKMQVSRSAYDVSASGLVNLQASKVPEDVIKVMMAPPTPPASKTAATPASEAPAETAAPPKSAAKDTASKPAATSKKTPPKKTPPPKKPPEGGR